MQMRTNINKRDNHLNNPRDIMSTIQLRGNYIEFVLLASVPLHNARVFDISIPDDICCHIIETLREKGYKHHQHHYKEYTYRNLVYESNEKNHKTFKKQLVSSSSSADEIHTFAYHKEKMPYHSFPSTINLDSVMYVSKLVFKVNNRLFINIEHKTNGNSSNNGYKKVYVNYNHDDNVDPLHVESSINSILELMKQIVRQPL